MNDRESVEMEPVSKHGHIVDELIDLQAGASRRLDGAIWELRNSAEKIKGENCRDADKHLTATKRHLADVERYLAAYRDYSDRLAELVG
jgi:hypothetical protein